MHLIYELFTNHICTTEFSPTWSSLHQKKINLPENLYSSLMVFCLVGFSGCTLEYFLTILMPHCRVHFPTTWGYDRNSDIIHI